MLEMQGEFCGKCDLSLKKTNYISKIQDWFENYRFWYVFQKPAASADFVRSKLIKFLWITPSNEGKMGQGAARGISRVNGCDTVVPGLTVDLKHNLDRFCIQNV